MNRLYILFILVISGFTAHATTIDEQFNQANTAYTKAQYDTAITLYKAIIMTGKDNAQVYFNMGNAYYKKKDIANAILNYERAHQLAPNDEDINFNLQLAQTMIVDKINVLPEFFMKRWWRGFSELYSSNTWATLSIVTFILTLLATIGYLFATRIWLKKMSFWIGCLFFTFSIISFTNSYVVKQSNTSRLNAIIMTSSVTLKSSPDEGGNDLFVLHEGSKVSIIDNVGEWLKIKIADGNTGWLKKNNLEEI